MADEIEKTPNSHFGKPTRLSESHDRPLFRVRTDMKPTQCRFLADECRMLSADYQQDTQKVIKNCNFTHSIILTRKYGYPSLMVHHNYACIIVVPYAPPCCIIPPRKGRSSGIYFLIFSPQIDLFFTRNPQLLKVFAT